MLERLMQAALITFLLHLIAGLSVDPKISTQVASPISEAPAPVVSSVWRYLQ